MIRVIIKLWQFIAFKQFDVIMASVDTILNCMTVSPTYWKNIRNTQPVAKDIEKVCSVYNDFIKHKDLIYCIKYNPSKFESLMNLTLIKVNITLESIFVVGSVFVCENRWYSIICTIVINAAISLLFIIFMYARDAAPFIIIIFETVEQMRFYDRP